MADVKNIPVIEDKKSNVRIKNDSGQDEDLTTEVNYTKAEAKEDIDNLAADVEACAIKAMQKWSQEKLTDIVQHTSRSGMQRAVQDFKEAKNDADKNIKASKDEAVKKLGEAKADIEVAMPTEATNTVTDRKKVSEGRSKVQAAKRDISTATSNMGKYSCTSNKDEIIGDAESLHQGAEIVSYNLVPKKPKKSSQHNLFNIKGEAPVREDIKRYARSIANVPAPAADDAFKPDAAILSAVREPF